MSRQQNDSRLLYLRDNLLKLEESLLELQRALAEMALKPVPRQPALALDGDAHEPGRIFTGASFEAVMRAIPADSTIVSIQRGDGGWKVRISEG